MSGFFTINGKKKLCITFTLLDELFSMRVCANNSETAINAQWNLTVV